MSSLSACQPSYWTNYLHVRVISGLGEWYQHHNLNFIQQMFIMQPVNTTRHLQPERRREEMWRVCHSKS